VSGSTPFVVTSRGMVMLDPTNNPSDVAGEEMVRVSLSYSREVLEVSMPRKWAGLDDSRKLSLLRRDPRLKGLL